MSTATDLYDKIRATIPTLLSGKIEIPNPYSLEDNNNNVLRDGWGVTIGASNPDTQTDNPEYTIVTEFGVVLSRSFATTAGNASPLVTATKELLGDISTLEDDFTGGRFTNADKAVYVDVVSRSEITNIVAGKFNHITTTISFAITHWK